MFGGISCFTKTADKEWSQLLVLFSTQFFSLTYFFFSPSLPGSVKKTCFVNLQIKVEQQCSSFFSQDVKCWPLFVEFRNKYPQQDSEEWRKQQDKKTKLKWTTLCFMDKSVWGHKKWNKVWAKKNGCSLCLTVKFLALKRKSFLKRLSY